MFGESYHHFHVFSASDGHFLSSINRKQSQAETWVRNSHLSGLATTGRLQLIILYLLRPKLQSAHGMELRELLEQFMEVSQNWGYLFGGPHNKDYSIWGSILGSPYFGKLPFIVKRESCDTTHPHALH